MKKIVAVVSALLMIFTCTAAMASSISETYTAPLYYSFPDGSMQMTSQVIATATHSYLLKNSTTNLYIGATTQGTTCRGGTRTTSVSIGSQPNFTAAVTNEGKTITVKFSGGSVTINYRDMIIVDELGNQTLSSGISTAGRSFNASQTHNK